MSYTNWVPSSKGHGIQGYQTCLIIGSLCILLAFSQLCFVEFQQWRCPSLPSLLPELSLPSLKKPLCSSCLPYKCNYVTEPLRLKLNGMKYPPSFRVRPRLLLSVCSLHLTMWATWDTCDCWSRDIVTAWPLLSGTPFLPHLPGEHLSILTSSRLNILSHLTPPTPPPSPLHFGSQPLCHHISVQFSHSVMSNSLQPHGLQHSRPPCPSPTPGVYSNSCSSHPAISSSVVPFSCPQSFLASGSFQMSQLFALGGQSVGVSDSTSVLPGIIPEKNHFGHLKKMIRFSSPGSSPAWSLDRTVHCKCHIRQPPHKAPREGKSLWNLPLALIMLALH